MFSVTTESNGATGLDELKTLESKINDLTSLFKSNEVNAIDTCRPRDPSIKGRPNDTRFCEYCRSNGHSISRCTKIQIDDSVNKLRNDLVEPRRQNITFSNDYRKNNRGNTRFNGPRNQGYQPGVATQTIILGSTSLIFNKKIHLLVTMLIDLLNPTNRHSLSNTNIEILNQILNNNHPHHNNSNSHNKARASVHQTKQK